MASPESPRSAATRPSKIPLRFMEQAKKDKRSFIQFFVMTGVFLMSVRSLAQKHRLFDLQEDTAALKEEQQTLNNRMDGIKRGLLHEASRDSSGVFASRLRCLFGDQN